MCLSVVLYKNKFLSSFHTKINPTLVGLPFCLIQLPFTPLCHVLSSNKKTAIQKCQPKNTRKRNSQKNLKVPFFTLTFPLPHKLLHQIEKNLRKKIENDKKPKLFPHKTFVHRIYQYMSVCSNPYHD